MGTLFGGYNSTLKIQETYMKGNGLQEIDKRVFEYFYPYAIPDFLCTKFGINGPRIIVSNACSSGGSAIGLAYDLIKSGTVDMAIAGGTDELNKLCLAGFNSLGAISEKMCAPYIKSKGINIGEGSGMFVLEKRESAEARKANILVQILGYGLNSDAYHITSPNPKGEGAYTLMKKLIENSGIPLADIDFINGHGTGTMANDTAEMRAINRLFEGSDLKVKLTSNKANVGHCMGAAGAVELAAAIGSLEKKKITPVYGEGEKNTDNVHVVLENEPVENSVALSNSFAFGGNNVSIAISDTRYQGNPHGYKSNPVAITGIDCVGNYHTSFQEFKSIVSNEPKEFSAEKGYIGNCKGIYRGIIPPINYNSYMPPDFVRRTDNIIKNSIVTSVGAIADANLSITNNNADSIGHVYASGVGPITTIRNLNEGIMERGLSKMNPFFFPNSVYNASPGYVTMNSRIKGATITLNAGGASLVCCMIYAKILINSGKAEKVVVTLSDDYNEIYHYSHDYFGVLSKTANINDFNNRENSVILSSGSISFVVESIESAEARGQKIYAELYEGVLKGGNGKRGLFHPSLANYHDVLSTAVSNAGIGWSDIDLYCSPCNGIRFTDRKEKKLVWDMLPENVDIASVKPYCGYNVTIHSAYSLALTLAAFENHCAYIVKNERLNKVQKDFQTAVIGAYAFGNTIGGMVLKRH